MTLPHALTEIFFISIGIFAVWVIATTIKEHLNDHD